MSSSSFKALIIDVIEINATVGATHRVFRFNTYMTIQSVCMCAGLQELNWGDKRGSSTPSPHRGARRTRHSLPISFSSPLVLPWLAEMLSAIWHLRGWKFVRVGSNELETSTQLKSLLISPGRWGPLLSPWITGQEEGWKEWRMSHWLFWTEKNEGPHHTSPVVGRWAYLIKNLLDFCSASHLVEITVLWLSSAFGYMTVELVMF